MDGNETGPRVQSVSVWLKGRYDVLVGQSIKDTPNKQGGIQMTVKRSTTKNNMRPCVYNVYCHMLCVRSVCLLSWCRITAEHCVSVHMWNFVFTLCCFIYSFCFTHCVYHSETLTTHTHTLSQSHTHTLSIYGHIPVVGMCVYSPLPGHTIAAPAGHPASGLS